jgi:propanol-preferring alcohol dehydrogenase
LKAAVYDPKFAVPTALLTIMDVPRPELSAGHVLVRVLACGVCRTDLHIAEGDLPPLHPRIIPGHQIVGEVVEGASAQLPLGTRVRDLLDGRRGRELLVLSERHGESM